MLNRKLIYAILIACVILGGCSPRVDNSVVEFVQETKNKKIAYKSEVPTYSPIEPFKYTASNLRDPFKPFIASNAEKNVPFPGGGPDLNRPREALEAYPLESLQMVGTLERQGEFFALLRDRVGIVHRASVGNYIGQNSGKIVKINQNEVEVEEWIADNTGSWHKQTAKILLMNPSSKTKGA